MADLITRIMNTSIDYLKGLVPLNALEEFTFERVYGELPFRTHEDLLRFLEGVRDHVVTNGVVDDEDDYDLGDPVERYVLEILQERYVYQGYGGGSWVLWTPTFGSRVCWDSRGNWVARYFGKDELEVSTGEVGDTTYNLGNYMVSVSETLISFDRNRRLVLSIDREASYIGDQVLDRRDLVKRTFAPTLAAIRGTPRKTSS